MTDNFVSSRYRVEGIRDSNDVTAALQELYDVFADLGLGQAMIEMTGNRTADLIVKHKESGVARRRRHRRGPAAGRPLLAGVGRPGCRTRRTGRTPPRTAATTEPTVQGDRSRFALDLSR